MVHFSLRLYDNTYEEWRGDSLDYKCLKRALKNHVDQQRSCTASHVQCRTRESGGSSTASGSELESQPLLPRTFSPSNSKHKLRGLVKTGTRPLLLKFVGFKELLEEQYAKVEHAYEKHITHLSGEFVVLREQCRSVESQATHDSVRNALVELHRLLNHLLYFALLNYTGFVKIHKSHAATCPPPSQLMHTHCARLRAFAFADATQCRTLLARVELLFADLFCEGDRSVAVASLMTRRGDVMDWATVHVGIKLGSCLILLVWVVWDSVIVPMFGTTERNKRDSIPLVATRAYPAYRGIGGCLLLHWLLGLSIHVWRSARINYRYIFELNPRTTPHVTAILSDATRLAIVYLVNVLLYYKVVNGYFPERILHRGYYPLALFAYTMYFPTTSSASA